MVYSEHGGAVGVLFPRLAQFVLQVDVLLHLADDDFILALQLIVAAEDAPKQYGHQNDKDDDDGD